LLARARRIMQQLGQAFQSLDQPDHRQRIPVTVVEQVLPDSLSFVLRNLVHDEEEPGDLDASLSRTSCYRFRVGAGQKAIRANLRS
jgi:hypothetical protein